MFLVLTIQILYPYNVKLPWHNERITIMLQINVLLKPEIKLKDTFSVAFHRFKQILSVISSQIISLVSSFLSDAMMSLFLRVYIMGFNVGIKTV